MRGAEDAAALVARGQAEQLQQAIQADLEAARPTIDDEVLNGIFEAHDDAGLRYLAVVVPSTRQTFEVGSSTVGRPRWRHVAPHQRYTEHGGLVRLIVAPKGKRKKRFRPRGRRHGRTLPFAIEFVPSAAETIRTQATRTFIAGVVGAMLLLAAALFMRHLVHANEGIQARLIQKQHLASLGEMSAVLAHEMRNPLASLKGNLQLLAERVSDRPADHAKVSRVLEETIRLEGLTESLLEFVRSGKIERRPTDPAALIRRAIAVAARDKAPRINTSLPQLPTWSLDGDRLQEAVVNIIDNALQAAAGRAEGVSVVARVAGQHLTIEVSDDGPGIAPEDRQRIFVPFVTTRTRGTGLGLPMARQIARAHGGELSVHDGPGGGALFRLIVQAPA